LKTTARNMATTPSPTLIRDCRFLTVTFDCGSVGVVMEYSFRKLSLNTIETYVTHKGRPFNSAVCSSNNPSPGATLTR
jgi:hypothetical protein